MIRKVNKMNLKVSDIRKEASAEDKLVIVINLNKVISSFPRLKFLDLQTDDMLGLSARLVSTDEDPTAWNLAIASCYDLDKTLTPTKVFICESQPLIFVIW